LSRKGMRETAQEEVGGCFPENLEVLGYATEGLQKCARSRERAERKE